MKRGKRLLALLLSVVLGAGCMMGCSKEGGISIGGKKGNGNKEEIQIGYWRSGHGIKWLEEMAAAFEEAYPEYKITIQESSDRNAVKTAWTMEEVDEIDLYMVTKVYDTEYMEPLDSLLDKTLEGDEKTLREKFNEGYLAFEESEDGHYYTLGYGGGAIGLFYNKDLFKKAGVTQLPRTTDEWTLVCDKLYTAGVTPMCHFNASSVYGYYDYVGYLYQAQYNGTDYYFDNFWACVDENGKSPSKEIFTATDGRYQTMKALEKFITPEYTLLGSNTKSHTEVQTEFLNDRAAMMINGSWLMTEMASVGGMDKIGEIRVPVLSAIVDRLTTVKKDADLRKLITAIDQVTEGEKQLSDFASGDGYVVDGVTVSKEDWDIVYEARNTIPSNHPEESLWVPKYAAQKEGAMKFLEFMYSDRGMKLYAESLHATLLLDLSSGEELDTSDWTELEKLQKDFIDSAVSLASDGVSKMHRIFVDGGATPFANVRFVNKFSAQNKADRLTADESWKEVLKAVDTLYDNTWLENIK